MWIAQQLAKLSAEHRGGELLYSPDLSYPEPMLHLQVHQEF